MKSVQAKLHLVIAATLLSGCASLCAQNSGGVIFVDIQGEVRVQNLKTKEFLDVKDIGVGNSIYEGHSVETPEQGKAVLLFTNGSMTTLSGKAKISIDEFKQAPFKGDSKSMVDSLEKEPSSSQTKIKLNYGDLVFNVKALNANSAFIMDSPVGSAVIRGTVGQLTVSIDADGNATGGVNMVEGSVSFTDPSGNTAAVPAGQATIVQVANDGQQIGATQTVDVPEEVTQSVTEVATESSEVAQDITTENISNAAEEADANSQDANETSPPEGEAPEAIEQSQEQETIETIQEQASGAAGGAIFAASGAGGNIDDIASLATDLTNTLAMEMASHAETVGLSGEIVVAATIIGAVEGAVAAATLAGMDADAIDRIRVAAGNINEPVEDLLGNLSIDDMLVNIDPSSLIAEVTDTGLSDDDISGLNAILTTQTFDVFIVDSDGDGLADATEELIGTDPDNPDSDGDLLNDGVEHHIFASNPAGADSDGDGVSDSVEVGIGTDPIVAEIFQTDRDGDAIPDDWEAQLGTDPDKRDTDDDGWWDGFEIGVGSNPLVKDIQIAETGFTVSPLSPGDPHAWLFPSNFPE